MPTVGSIEYYVVTGTIAGIATFNTDVETAINNGYSVLDVGPQSDGVNIWQVLFKGSAASFVAEYEIAVATVGLAGLGEFEIVGDQTQNFHPGYKFTVTRSTGNDGVYTVKSSSYSAPNTTIIAVEAVADGTDDGYIEAHSPSVGP